MSKRNVLACVVACILIARPGFAQGTIPPRQILSISPTNDGVPVGNGTIWQTKVISDCDAASSALTYDASANTFGCNTIAASPGGSNTQVQFNDAGVLGGDAGLTYNKTTDTLDVAGDLNVGGTLLPVAVQVSNSLRSPYIEAGTSGPYASVGAIRLSRGVGETVAVVARNAADSGNISLLKLDATDVIQIANGAIQVTDLTGLTALNGAVIFADTADLVADGVRFSAADGVLTLLGLGNGNDENLTIDFDNAATNEVNVGTGTGVLVIDFGTIILEAAFNSSDGTAGLTQTCATPVTAVTIKNGLITAVTCP